MEMPPPYPGLNSNPSGYNGYNPSYSKAAEAAACAPPLQAAYYDPNKPNLVYAPPPYVSFYFEIELKIMSNLIICIFRVCFLG